ncbi:MAG: pilus assembly PilX N-terminal domain-containing protein [Deltaproteobacteria bacterium]|nr:pilus assembly PilX N-terminal domain-containing protein [Deltaproteobacteria bacterium]
MNLNNEKGAVLVVSLIIMGLLMVIGTSITMTSSIELNVARNEKVAKTAFYRAENGRIMASKAILSADAGTTWTDGASFEGNADITMADGSFFTEGFDVSNTVDNVSSNPDMQLSGNLGADLDIDKIQVGPMPGASAEFGAGYEGVGHEGMVQAIYRIDSIGREPSGSEARVQLQYRLLPY